MKLLIMDDDLDFGMLVAETAGTLGIDYQIETDSRHFISLYDRMSPDVVVLDIFMPNIDGIELLSDMRKPENASGQLDLLLVSGSAYPCLDVAEKLAATKSWIRPRKTVKPICVDMLHAYFRSLQGHDDSDALYAR